MGNYFDMHDSNVKIGTVFRDEEDEGESESQVAFVWIGYKETNNSMYYVVLRCISSSLYIFLRSLTNQMNVKQSLNSIFTCKCSISR